MAAIITDQIRILNAKNFVAGVTSTANAYYSFIGLPNPTEVQSLSLIHISEPTRPY